jgi:hypothetical protein
MILTGGWGNRDGGHHLSFLNGRVFPAHNWNSG